MEAGVYLISNNVNGKCYVGSTVHLDQRRREHLKLLELNIILFRRDSRIQTSVTITMLSLETNLRRI